MIRTLLVKKFLLGTILLAASLLLLFPIIQLQVVIQSQRLWFRLRHGLYNPARMDDMDIISVFHFLFRFSNHYIVLECYTTFELGDLLLTLAEYSSLEQMRWVILFETLSINSPPPTSIAFLSQILVMVFNVGS